MASQQGRTGVTGEGKSKSRGEASKKGSTHLEVCDGVQRIILGFSQQLPAGRQAGRSCQGMVAGLWLPLADCGPTPAQARHTRCKAHGRHAATHFLC